MGRLYTLMHKNLEVATLEIDEDNGVISKVIKVLTWAICQWGRSSRIMLMVHG